MVDLLRAHALFGKLPPRSLEQLGSYVTTRRVRKGTTIFVKGDPGAAQIAVLKGTVKITVPAADGRETVLNLIRPGELFGEIAQILIRTAPEQLKTIGAALAGNDLKRTYEEAHSLKGAVAAFEAPEVLTYVAAVERHAKGNDGAAAAAAFAQAHPLVESLLGELAAHVQ